MVKFVILPTLLCSLNLLKHRVLMNQFVPQRKAQPNTIIKSEFGSPDHSPHYSVAASSNDSDLYYIYPSLCIVSIITRLFIWLASVIHLHRISPYELVH